MLQQGLIDSSKMSDAIERKTKKLKKMV